MGLLRPFVGSSDLEATESVAIEKLEMSKCCMQCFNQFALEIVDYYT